MSVSFGNVSIKDMYYGSTKIGEAYLGSTKVYKSGSAPVPGPIVYVNMPDEYNGNTSTVYTNLIGMPSSSDKDIFVFKYEACFVTSSTSNFAGDIYWDASTTTKWRIRQHNSSRSYGVGFVTDGTYGTSNWQNADGIITNNRTVNNIIWKCWSNWSQRNIDVVEWMPVKFIFERSLNKATVYLNNTLIGTCNYNDDPINITRFGLLMETTNCTKAALRTLIVAGCNTMEQAINL